MSGRWWTIGRRSSLHQRKWHRIRYQSALMGIRCATGQTRHRWCSLTNPSQRQQQQNARCPSPLIEDGWDDGSQDNLSAGMRVHDAFPRILDPSSVVDTYKGFSATSLAAHWSTKHIEGCRDQERNVPLHLQTAAVHEESGSPAVNDFCLGEPIGNFGWHLPC